MNKTFRITLIKGDKVRVAYGPLSFDVHVFKRADGMIVVSKPASVYIYEPEYTEMINQVRQEWKYNTNNI